jgi:ABC-type uncharacterized transport system ATPase subunit
MPPYAIFTGEGELKEVYDHKKEIQMEKGEQVVHISNRQAEQFKMDLGERARSELIAHLLRTPEGRRAIENFDSFAAASPDI